MHRISLGFLILAALYVTAGCTATRAPEVAPAVPPQPSVVKPAAPVPPSAPAAAPQAPVPAPVTLSPTAQPHIALMLPLKHAKLEKASMVVEQGFLAASKVQPGSLPIRIYACSDESKEIAELYRQAVSNGAQAVVGPLTPAGVAALAAQPIPVPTLALNRAEIKAPEKFYLFGLVLENEARQAARLASMADLHSAIIVSTDTTDMSLSKRLVQAFTDEWIKQGGKIVATKIFKGDNTIFADLPIDPGNVVFVAATAEKARMFRPFLNAMLPVYATSQIFNGNADTLINYDLRDVVFLDMPWLLQQDHAAVFKYPRSNPPLEIDMERLYALGIDAYRLIRIMIDGRQQSAMPLDGVTGTIRLNPNHQFDREAVLAEFKQGMGLTPEAQAELKAAKRAAGASAPAATDPVENE
ncbi:MAG TPA: penicillin-binding protein activator [Gallionellaceae bacterium]